ncbi:GntR family transcriptional regulator [Zafaria cholistanensis]|uniref:GntR family transcriptional regulator n=1 Tax=Zafaria cholistanensis TaxID=1682741 RepID=A0A5A7NUW1_9MICC|nr:FadR/GntR family transcriptional regulator [Zafaria cholistanensis]GER23747.1 GntR family transcriptional regulator [Zafaria cholistanensis]
MNLSDSWTAGQQIVRVSAAEAVFTSLRQAIEGGELPVGTRLSSEAAMAQQYGVSRSVVREALRSCASLGLTETRTGKGTFVVSDHVGGDLALGQYSARDLTEARPHIEVPAAGLAAQRRSEDELQLLRDIMAAMDREKDPEAWVALDSAFHGAIARMSGNRVFEKVVADIRDAMANQSETLNMVAGRQADSDVEHREIVAAIEAASPEQAAEAMRRHLAAVDAALDRVLRR